MNKTVILSVSSTEERAVPAGRTFGGFRFRLVAASGAAAQSDITTELSFAFADAQPGTYTASVLPVDTEGVGMGPAIEVAVIVPEDEPPPPDAVYLQPTGLVVQIV